MHVLLCLFIIQSHYTLLSRVYQFSSSPKTVLLLKKKKWEQTHDTGALDFPCLFPLSCSALTSLLVTSFLPESFPTQLSTSNQSGYKQRKNIKSTFYTTQQ